MELLTIIILILLGVILLLVEFMLIPGITVAGVGCVISFGAAVVLSFRYYGSLAGFIALAAILIFVPLFLYLFFKGRAARPIMLETGIDGVAKVVDELLIQPGDVGETTSRCTPGGKAKINGISVEVRSLGTYVDPQTKIEVVKIEGNTVIVKPIK